MARIEDLVFVEMQRASRLANRDGIVVPSLDLFVADQRTGSRKLTKSAINRLVKAGKVRTVRRDLLVLSNVTGQFVVGVSELIGAIAPWPYMITGGRALQEYKLTDQHYFSTTVLVPSRVSKFEYDGEKAVFIAATKDKIWGWKNVRKLHIATPDRAIIDSLSSSRYNVSFSQALTALNLAIQGNSKFLEELISSTRRYGSHSLARRIGFLISQLVGHDAAEPFGDMIGFSRTPVLLRPGGRIDGVLDTKWRLVINATTELEGRQV